jgi:acetoin utilization deacetylase AcuC-like enzyme
VYHGNGTEAIVRNLVPSVMTSQVKTPFGVTGTLQTPSYSPWLSETDADDVLFVSVHGYGGKKKKPS